MDSNVKATALLRFLEGSLYHGKIEEIYSEIEKWLGYIPQTFPHYTRHTIFHSNEIITQLSLLLFKENNPKKPTIKLSPTEAYILIAAAYLHDVGMVASDREKAEILMSESWREWTRGQGGGAKRWEEIEAFRAGGKPSDENLRNFLADVQVRFLLAEFIRRSHHNRTEKIILLHQSELGRFAFDDPILIKSIADVCAAHGLSKHEIEDKERFPDRRNIRGDQVNLQFLATLLRLGDLLDISNDRACPLLLNAASPLPSDSLAHWTQYKRITHRLTAPDKIEIIAKCQNQEEHRYLRDWCQWLVNEMINVAILKEHWKRHENWRVPKVSLLGERPTIKIQPNSEAKYIFGDWKLELDQEAIYQRLIFDVHEHRLGFILELLQNSLDAIRCRMYADYKDKGQEPPDYPTKFPEELKKQFAVHIKLEEKARLSQLSGEQEIYQILTIEDNGVGMDRDIIQKYFLQVGRSYYNTDEFRRQFKFSPTSRFGVGFLSVFAVSDLVEVDTYKKESSDGPIRLTLTGPRNYLLMEKGSRTTGGTKISVVLRQPIGNGHLTKLIRRWCRKVEVPIIVKDMEQETIITFERPEDFIYEIPLANDPKSKFVVRNFPINRPGIEGELYVFALCEENGESWIAWAWANNIYPQLHPNAYAPNEIRSIYCLNGIAYNAEKDYLEPMGIESRIYSGRIGGKGQRAERLDYRNPLEHLDITRKGIEFWKVIRPQIDSRWQEIIEQHLAETPRAHSDDSWIYKQRLSKNIALPNFWENQPGMIRIFKEGKSYLVSLKKLQEQPVITVVIRPFGKGYEDNIKPKWDNDAGSIWGGDLEYLNDDLRVKIFAKHIAHNVRWLNSGYLAIDFIDETAEEYFEGETYSIQLVEFPDEINFYFEAEISKYGDCFLNKKHFFTQYLKRFESACNEGKYNLTEFHFKKLIDIIHLAYYAATSSAKFRKLENYLHELRCIPILPKELKPPEIKFTYEMFHLRPPD